MTIPATQPLESDEVFHTGEVLSIAGAHFTNDTFSAFLAPLLPALIEKLSLTLTHAGALSAFLQLPAILNPFIGYLADVVNLRYLVIFAPAATATLISLSGLAPTYLALAALLLMVGVSIASFHAPAPAMIAHVSGKQVGRGMSFFMAAGEMGRTVGPLLVVNALALWGLEGIARLMVIGWGASLVLWWRFRSVPVRANKPRGIREALPRMARLFPLLAGILILRHLMVVGLQVYLPTYMHLKGASLRMAGASLSILEIAGVIGALTSGTLSDRLGRKTVLGGAILSSALLMVLFLAVDGVWIVPLLLLLGFTAISTGPVMLALVQDHFEHHRAAANGLYLSMAFLLRSLATVVAGMIGDTWGLPVVYRAGVVTSLFALVLVWRLPEERRA